MDVIICRFMHMTFTFLMWYFQIPGRKGFWGKHHLRSLISSGWGISTKDKTHLKGRKNCTRWKRIIYCLRHSRKCYRQTFMEFFIFPFVIAYLFFYKILFLAIQISSSLCVCVLLFSCCEKTTMTQNKLWKIWLRGIVPEEGSLTLGEAWQQAAWAQNQDITFKNKAER